MCKILYREKMEYSNFRNARNFAVVIFSSLVIVITFLHHWSFAAHCIVPQVSFDLNGF